MERNNGKMVWDLRNISHLVDDETMDIIKSSLRKIDIYVPISLDHLIITHCLIQLAWIGIHASLQHDNVKKRSRQD